MGFKALETKWTQENKTNYNILLLQDAKQAPECMKNIYVQRVSAKMYEKRIFPGAKGGFESKYGNVESILWT